MKLSLRSLNLKERLMESWRVGEEEELLRAGDEPLYKGLAGGTTRWIKHIMEDNGYPMTLVGKLMSDWTVSLVMA